MFSGTTDGMRTRNGILISPPISGEDLPGVSQVEGIWWGGGAAEGGYGGWRTDCNGSFPAVNDLLICI